LHTLAKPPANDNFCVSLREGFDDFIGVITRGLDGFIVVITRGTLMIFSNRYAREAAGFSADRFFRL
jgi:hypothetical protein